MGKGPLTIRHRWHEAQRGKRWPTGKCGMFRRRRYGTYLGNDPVTGRPIFVNLTPRRLPIGPMLAVSVAIFIAIALFSIYFGLGFFYLIVLMAINRALPKARR